MSDRRFGPTDVAALAATLAALAAVGVAVWDNVQQRKFNRLSVIPWMDYTLTKEGDTEGSVILSNEGVGPAEIRGLEIGFCGGDESASFTSWNQARGAMEDRELTLIGYHDLKNGEIVGQGHRTEWVRFESRDTTNPTDPIQLFIDEVAFRVRYTSIYDEAFSLERRAECLPAANPPR